MLDVKESEGIPCKKVEYFDNRPFRPETKDLINLRFDKLKIFLYRKYFEWEYEQEYRVVRCFYKKDIYLDYKNHPLLKRKTFADSQKKLVSSFSKVDNKKVKVLDNEYDIFVYDFPIDIIKSITFGCRMTNENKDLYLDLLNSDRRFNHITIYQADVNP